MSILKRATGVLVALVGAFVLLYGYGTEDAGVLSRYGFVAIGGAMIGAGAKMAKKSDVPAGGQDRPTNG